MGTTRCYLKTTREWEEITDFEDQEFLDEWKEKILAFAKTRLKKKL